MASFLARSPSSRVELFRNSINQLLSKTYFFAIFNSKLRRLYLEVTQCFGFVNFLVPCQSNKTCCIDMTILYTVEPESNHGWIGLNSSDLIPIICTTPLKTSASWWYRLRLGGWRQCVSAERRAASTSAPHHIDPNVIFEFYSRNWNLWPNKYEWLRDVSVSLG